MVNRNSDKVSIWIALLVAIVTGISVGASSPIAEFFCKRQEEKRLFLLHQIQAYGGLYVTSMAGTKEQLYKESNDKIIYLEPEELSRIAVLVFPELFPILKAIPGRDYTQVYKGAEELSKILWQKYEQKLEQYMKLYIKRSYALEKKECILLKDYFSETEQQGKKTKEP